ncbi:SARP family transcriptional regulator [Streptomyces echinoruber]|uniref:SARP family transcriptional regulator n=2 Tax=Streptomyces TaxID=1883 RepID=A0A918RHM9_9ACTN|nr:SARP family transcriptional regulator [Streptomyces echinoruber]
MITILGNLSMTGRKGGNAAPSAPKERKVLALLLFNYARPVPIHLFIDELWADNPPKRARTALQTYVLNLRTRLACGLGIPSGRVRDEILVTRSEGYQFQLEGHPFDLHEFLRLVDLGEKSVADGDDARAIEALTKAEGLWTGPVLPDVEHGLPLQSEIARLEQRRTVAREIRIESELRLGRHRELVSELSMLALRHPYHERYHEYLMFCLNRLGHRVQALEVFRRLRYSLVDELGLEPSERIQNLQREILESRCASYAALP